MKKEIVIFFLSFFLLSSCSSAQTTSTVEVITVQYTAATQPWLTAISACAGKNVISSELRSADTLDISQTNMTIRIGQTFDQTAPTYQIGTEEILVIGNRQNPVSRLTGEQVLGLFSGQIRNWKDVKGSDTPIQVWVFAPGEDVEQIFEQAGLGGTPVSSNARLATGPDEMIQAIANDVNAIGITTSHWKTEGVAELFTVASVPMLASTPAEPTGTLLQILDCLQK